MSDYEMVKHPWPLRTKVWPDYSGIDAGIRFAVRALHARGFETCQSCEGGEGHAYDHPTVDLIAGGDAAGFMAVGVLAGYGLPVRDLAQAWNLDALGRPYETIWRITFRSAFPERADDWLMFLWGYQAQPDPRAEPVTPSPTEEQEA